MIISVIAYIIYGFYIFHKKTKFNKYVLGSVVIVIIVFILIFPNFNQEKSVAYQNDVEGFKAHGMSPLNLWMYFHMSYWFMWMIFPHLLGLFTKEKTMLKIAGVVWVVFIVVWISSCVFGKFLWVVMR